MIRTSGFQEGKQFGLIVVSTGGGRQALEALKELAFQVVHCWRMRLVTIDSYPYLGVLAKGEEVGEVLEDKGAIDQAKKLIKELTIKIVDFSFAHTSFCAKPTD